MTFQQIADSLPNGFHDAELQRFEMDYVHRKLRFDLEVWIGDMNSTQARELYRPARVTLELVVGIQGMRPTRLGLSLSMAEATRTATKPSGQVVLPTPICGSLTSAIS